MRHTKLSGPFFLATAAAASSASSSRSVRQQPILLGSELVTVEAASQAPAAGETLRGQVLNLPGRHYWPSKIIVSGLGFGKTTKFNSSLKAEFGFGWQHSSEVGA